MRDPTNGSGESTRVASRVARRPRTLFRLDPARADNRIGDNPRFQASGVAMRVSSCVSTCAAVPVSVGRPRMPDSLPIG